MNKEIRKCNCGCGEHVSGKANYRPGHDARHAGIVGRALAENERDKAARKAYDQMTPGLQHKVQRIIANRVAGHVIGEQVADVTVGVVKVGRWEYPARKTANGTYERNTARDGSGEWVKVHESAFRPGA